jgi:autotransporter translocation and assembly factor TamB
MATLVSPGLAEVLSASPSQTVRGQIIKVDGQTYVVQDLSGKEVNLHVDSNTMMMDGTQLREGDTITADVTAKGQASYIIPGPAPSQGQKGVGSTSPDSARDPRPQ